MIYTLTLNPALDKTAKVNDIIVNGLNRIDDIVIDAGGKGINVTKTIIALQHPSVALGFVGGHTGDIIAESLTQKGINHKFVKISGETRTNLKILDHNNNLTEFNESGPLISDIEIAELLNIMDKTLKDGDLLVLSGSIPKGVSANIYQIIIDKFQRLGVKCLLDADDALFCEGIKAHPYLIKPNKYELCKYFNLESNVSNEVLIEKCQQLLDDGIKNIVISLGGDGAIYLIDNKIYQCRALSINIKSTVGAGDAMVAALAIAIEQKIKMEEMIKLSMAASAGACLSNGTNPADIATVTKLKSAVMIKEGL